MFNLYHAGVVCYYDKKCNMPQIYADRFVTLSEVWVRIPLTLFAHQYQNKSIATSIGCDENLL